MKLKLKIELKLTKLIIEKPGPATVTAAEWLTRSSTDLKVVGSSLPTVLIFLYKFSLVV